MTVCSVLIAARWLERRLVRPRAGLEAKQRDAAL
jgi:hypothetical protein